MGIDGNEIDDPVAWHCPSLLCIGTEPVLTYLQRLPSG